MVFLQRYPHRGSLDIYQPPALLGNSDRASSSWQRRERTQTRKLVEAALRHVSPSVSPDPNLNPPLTRSNAKNTSPYTNVESKFHRRWTNFDKIPVYPPLNPRLIIFHVGGGIADDEESPETFYTKKYEKSFLGNRFFFDW